MWNSSRRSAPKHWSLNKSEHFADDAIKYILFKAMFRMLIITQSCLISGVNIVISQHWFRQWLVDEQATHYELTLTLSQCTLTGSMCTGMPLEYHWLTQCTLGYQWATQRILTGDTGTPLGKLSWNCPILECRWRNSDYCSLHWNTTGGL